MKTIKIIINDKKRKSPKHGKFRMRTDLGNATSEEIKDAIELLQYCYENCPKTQNMQTDYTD